MRLAGSRILLTGASGGIGRAVALRLAARQARITISGRDTGRLCALAHEIRAAGGCADIVVADLDKPEGPASLVNQAQAIDPLIDVLVNCAGVSQFSDFEQTSPEAIETLWRANVLAPMRLAQEVLPYMRRRRNGLIVNVGSIFGSIGFPCFAAYSSTKFALRGFSEALRRELAGSGVNVLYFAPRYTRTAINGEAVQRMADVVKMHQDEPDDVALELVRAIECDDRERLLGGPERLFVSLNQWLPRIVDLALGRPAARMRPFAALPAPSAPPSS
jgi:short-subunit dehydrogenase